MKYGNALYIAVALFMVMGVSAMAAGQETAIKIFNDATTNLDISVSNLGSLISNSFSSKQTISNEAVSQIPEFPALIIPVATIIGLMFLFQHKKTKEQK